MDVQKNRVFICSLAVTWTTPPLAQGELSGCCVSLRLPFHQAKSDVIEYILLLYIHLLSWSPFVSHVESRESTAVDGISRNR
jgi:hypothetical protein